MGRDKADLLVNLHRITIHIMMQLASLGLAHQGLLVLKNIFDGMPLAQHGEANLQRPFETAQEAAEGGYMKIVVLRMPRILSGMLRALLGMNRS